MAFLFLALSVSAGFITWTNETIYGDGSAWRGDGDNLTKLIDNVGVDGTNVPPGAASFDLAGTTDWRNITVGLGSSRFIVNASIESVRYQPYLIYHPFWVDVYGSNDNATWVYLGTNNTSPIESGLLNQSVEVWQNFSFIRFELYSEGAGSATFLYEIRVFDLTNTTPVNVWEMNLSYSNPVLQLSNQSYSTNYLLAGATNNLTNVWLFWNQSVLVPAVFNSTKAVAFHGIPGVASNNVTVNNSWIYEDWLTNGTKVNVTGVVFQQNISRFNLTSCATNSNASLTFFVYDEDTWANINNSTISATFIVYTSNVLNTSYSFILNLTGTNNISICSSALGLSYNLDGYLEYQRFNDYPMRRFYIVNSTPSNVTTNYSLYLIPLLLSEMVKFTVRDISFISYPYLYANVQRYFPENDSYVTIAIDRSDANGVFVMPLKIPGPYYRVSSYLASGEPVYVWSQFQIPNTACADVCDYLLQIKPSAVDVGTSIFSAYKTTGSCAMDYVTNITSCSYLNTAGVAQTVNFTVYNASGNNAMVCTQQSSSSSAGAFACGLGEIGSFSYKAILRVYYTDTTWGEIAKELINFKTVLNRNLGSDGLIIAIILILGITLALAAFSPKIAVIGFGAGLAICTFLGLISVGSNGLYSPLFLGGGISVLAVVFYLIVD